jgi:uncharacterized protein YcbX
VPGRLTSIHRFPVKSCQGATVEKATVEPWGLAGDRRWMLVDEDGEVITAREVNQMLLIRPELTSAGLRVIAPQLPAREITTPESGHVPVSLWSSRLTATPVDAETDAWFSKALGREAHLVYLDDPHRRPTDPRFSEPDDRVNFADGYPLLLATEESLAALNDELLSAADVEREPLPMTRFRPNLVVAGFEPWAEDDWRRIRVGDAVFRVVKGCARCVITTIDPTTAEREKEPIKSLARIRRWDGATWFAINLIPDTPGVTIRVGDTLEVLDSVEPGVGPIRPVR